MVVCGGLKGCLVQRILRPSPILPHLLITNYVVYAYSIISWHKWLLFIANIRIGDQAKQLDGFRQLMGVLNMTFDCPDMNVRRTFLRVRRTLLKLTFPARHEMFAELFIMCAAQFSQTTFGIFSKLQRIEFSSRGRRNQLKRSSYDRVMAKTVKNKNHAGTVRNVRRTTVMCDTQNEQQPEKLSF